MDNKQEQRQKLITIFSDVDVVIEDELRFKKELYIGENAYKSMKAKKATMDIIDFGSGVLTGAGIASSSFVAGTFFSGSSLLTMFGLTTAVTPIGWVIAAGAVSGGIALAINKKMRQPGSAVDIVPKFINTQIDVLAAKLYEQFIPIAIYIAQDALEEDPLKSNPEKSLLQSNSAIQIKQFFRQEWGYSKEYTDAAFKGLFEQRDQIKIDTACHSLLAYQQSNPDCNELEMTNNFINFLGKITSNTEQSQQRFEQVKTLLSRGKATEWPYRALQGFGRFRKKQN